MISYSLFNPKWLSNNYELSAVAYYFKNWTGFEMSAPHQHQHIEIMYVLSSSCLIELEDRTIPLQKGQFIILDAGKSHRLIVEEQLTCRMLNIEFTFNQNDSNLLPFGLMVASDQIFEEMLLTPFDYLVLNDNEDILLALKQLIRIYDNEGWGNSLYKQSLYFQLLRNLSRLWKEHQTSLPSSTQGHIKLALEYIHHYYDQDIKASTIAKEININENYLQRIFKKQMKVTIVEYLLVIRMKKAKMLLETSDLPIIEISDYIGINSRQYFSKLFKKYYGLSPKEYRLNFQSTMSE